MCWEPSGAEWGSKIWCRTQLKWKSGGIRVRVLNLETIVALKEELTGEKDRAVLPVLRRTLQEKQGGK